MRILLLNFIESKKREFEMVKKTLWLTPKQKLVIYKKMRKELKYDLFILNENLKLEKKILEF